MAKARRLTEAGVARVRAGDGRQELPDTEVPGLRLVVQPNGRKSWAVRVRVNGKPVKYTVGPYPAHDLNEARRVAKLVTGAAERGEDPRGIRQERRANTVEATVAEWIEKDQKQRGCRSWQEVEHLFKKEVIPTWGSRAVASITARDCDRLIEAVFDRPAPITARRLHSYLHRLFKWSLSKGRVDGNPVAGLQKPGRETSRERVLTDAELVEVWNAAEKEGWPFGAYVRLLLLTGARPGTKVGSNTGLLKTRWIEVGEKAIDLSGDRTKTGDAHLLPLSKQAKVLMAEFPRFAGCEFVFTHDGKACYSAVSGAKKRIDAHILAARQEADPEAEAPPGWTLHDLRRTVATGLQKMKIPYDVRRAVLGHRVTGIGGVYDKYEYMDEKRDALAKWGRYVDRLLAPEAKEKVVNLRHK